MITIYAEKPDMGTKIAAALDAIHLTNGKDVSFDEIAKYEKQIKYQRFKEGCFKIKYQGQDAYVTWGYGHMCGLKQAYDYNPDYKKWSNLPLPFIPNDYELKLTAAKDQYRLIKGLFDKSDCIICATDDDREGDLIFDYLYRFMKCKKPFKRALFNKQSKEEFQKAFSKQYLVDSKDRQGVIDAGRARSAGDFIVGASPTVAMTLKYPGKNMLSVGRVQTAVLNIPVQRELEIMNFKPTDYWVLKGRFTLPSNQAYIGTYVERRILEKNKAFSLLDKLKGGSKQGVVSKVDKKTYKKGKPFLYSLASLQMDANKTYGFSLERTLELAQSLYEKGYTTYPRTDSVHLPNDMADEMKSVISMLTTINDYKHCASMVDNFNGKDKHYFDSDKVESHYAIVPTSQYPNNLTSEEKRIYDLIARVTLCMLYDDATMSKTQITTTVDGEDFITSGTSVVDPGFMSLTGIPKENVIPDVNEGDKVASLFALETKQTEPPKRYTDATLLSAMINCGKNIEDDELRKLMSNGPGGKPRGLGRPSSQASILTTLITRGYVEKKGKTIYPTKLGMAMIECFPVEDLKSAEMTAQWEKRLDDIEVGKDTYSNFMKDLEDHVRIWTKQIIDAPKKDSLSNSTTSFDNADTGITCPKCGKPMRKLDWGYSCTGYKKDDPQCCSFSISNKISGKKLTDNQIKKLLAFKPVPVKGLTSKKGAKYNATLKMNAVGKIEFSFDNSKPSPKKKAKQA